ncbi:CvpA family protein [Solimonas marina]|uniref:CvpA family protein n=1 Tax=Solimonas marina TaxID=2714601 RepID=A0A970B827_9GAMM|nr:CvpA family protein [Solimonas marina]NKF24290.1 CvpA family protein [Solimonas marina]
MTWIDYCIVALALISVLVGVVRGFTREILSLCTWVFAFLMAALFGGRAAYLLEGHIADPALREAVSCGIVFFLALLVGTIVTHFVVQAVRDSRFSASDRTLGAGVGVLRAVIVLVLFVIVASRLGAAQDGWWQKSRIVPHFVGIAHGVEALIPQRWLNFLSAAPAVADKSLSSPDH